MWHQKAVPPGEVLVWDYHVFVVARAEKGWMVWDQDSYLPMPSSMSSYLEQSFWHMLPGAHTLEGGNLNEQMLIRIAPIFRVVEAEFFVKNFSTDRSHMRTGNGAWIKDPPPWAAPQAQPQAMNLMRFVSMVDEKIGGEVFDFDSLRQKFS